MIYVLTKKEKLEIFKAYLNRTISLEIAENQINIGLSVYTV